MTLEKSTNQLMAITFLASLVFFQGLMMARNTPLGAPPDELAHIAYIQDVIDSRNLLPDYRNGTILDRPKLNYLSHPPLFYSVSGSLGKALSLDARESFFFFRVLNVIFVTLGFILTLLAAAQLGAGPIFLGALTMGCLATPMFGYLAGSINNDNLLYLGMSLCFFSVLRGGLDEKSMDGVSGVTLSVGLSIVFLTKATGGLFLICFGVVYSALNKNAVMELFKGALIVRYLIVPFILASAYYGFTFREYGELFPHPGKLYADNYPENDMPVLEVGAIFLTSLFQRLSRVMSHLPVQPFSNHGRIFFYVMFFCPIIAWLAWRPFLDGRQSNTALTRTTDATMITVVIVLAIHFWVVFNAYERTGLLPGIQPRYYFYLIPVIWLLTLPSGGQHFQKALLAVFLLSSSVAFWSSAPGFLLRQTEQQNSKSKAITIPYALPSGDNTISLRFSTNGTGRGNVDSFSLAGRKLTVRGWALDQKDNEGATRVVLEHNGYYLGSIQPRQIRTDVEKQFDAPAARLSGFEISISRLPETIAACEINVHVESRDGILRRLRNARCQ